MNVRNRGLREKYLLIAQCFVHVLINPFEAVLLRWSEVRKNAKFVTSCDNALILVSYE